MEKAPGRLDHPHVANATFVYQLPFGAGRNWNSGNKFVSSAMSNWQLSGIFTFTSGSPLSINSTCVGGRANVGSTPYLNKAAFVDPANYTASNIARSAPLGVRREFHLIERVRLSFQADAFNLTNAVNFAAPATNIDTATFGIFSAMSNQPRKLQLGARVSF